MCLSVDNDPDEAADKVGEDGEEGEEIACCFCWFGYRLLSLQRVSAEVVVPAVTAGVSGVIVDTEVELKL